MTLFEKFQTQGGYFWSLGLPTVREIPCLYYTVGAEQVPSCEQSSLLNLGE